MVAGSVADTYPGYEKFVTDPDADRTLIRSRIQTKKEKLILHAFCVFITELSLHYK